MCKKNSKSGTIMFMSYYLTVFKPRLIRSGMFMWEEQHVSLKVLTFYLL